MPTVEEALQIGWKQHQAGNLRGAEDIYRQVLAVAPGNENAWCFLGMACHDQGRYDEASAAYREAIRIKPNFPVAHSNFGNTLKQLGKLDEAEASCRTALQYKPDYSTAYNNLGVVLVAQGRLEEAAAVFEKALEYVPQDVVAQANLGAALVRQGRFEEGTQISQRALKINPNYAEAHKNQAIVWLLLGDFARGWPEYEWRWKCPGSALPNVPGPRWDGSPLDGKTILLHWEQGLGDTVHFVRYARRLKQQGARVAVCCQKPLKRLLAWCDGIDELVAAGEPLPAFDYWSPLLSLPGILQTTMETIPGDTAYIHPDLDKIKHWRQRLSENHGYRIGIAWQGSPDFHADRQRSIPLAHFERLAQIPGVRLISLQKGYGAEQLAGIQGKFEVIDFGQELDESGPFLDTAAIISCLDLVISSDTCVPHLAGAIGAPTWVGLSVSPDWRWLLHREDSPWYPTMRLFRQQTLGDWTEVFERIATSLAERMAQQEVLAASAESSAIESAAPPGAAAELSGAREPEETSEDAEPVADARIPLAETPHGAFLCPAGRADSQALRQLAQGAAELNVLGQLLRAGDTVVDLGAGEGGCAIPLARFVGSSGKIHAYESAVSSFQILCGNVALNRLNQIATFCPSAWPHHAAGEVPTDADLTAVQDAALERVQQEPCQLIRMGDSLATPEFLDQVARVAAGEPILWIQGIAADGNSLPTALAAGGYRIYRRRVLQRDLGKDSGSRASADPELFPSLLCIPGRVQSVFADLVRSDETFAPLGNAE